MWQRKKHTRVFLLGSAWALIVLGVLFAFNQRRQNRLGVASTDATLLAAEKTIIRLPVRLAIPKISVDASIESLGLNSAGVMDTPDGPRTVAWFNLGPSPGEIGNAVITGHFGWKDGIPSIFDDLHKLKKGDAISVKNADGKSVHFVVRELRTYDADADASVVFSGNGGAAHLNLITCQGLWNKEKKSYSERLVVFTDRQ